MNPINHFFRLLSTLAACLLLAGSWHTRATAQGGPMPEVGFSVVKTDSIRVREGLVYSGGSFSTEIDTIFSAILIKHANEFILFDTGLGTRIAEQYEQDMPLLRRLLFKYQEPVTPAKAQLQGAGIAPSRIILSHSHWDHAGGIVDFPGVPVLVTPEEMEVILKPQSKAGAAWPSQVGDKSIQWQTVSFEARPYQGFERSMDLYNDGKVVLVPLSGHTPGSLGLFLTVDSGKRYFFVGDVVWNAGALQNASPKIWLASVQVDNDAALTQKTIEQVRAVVQNNPGIVVVPAHDGPVQNALGFFPQWVR